jgi:hypothetical protein
LCGKLSGRLRGAESALGGSCATTTGSCLGKKNALYEGPSGSGTGTDDDNDELGAEVSGRDGECGVLAVDLRGG